jgi:hypothetical protein
MSVVAVVQHVTLIYLQVSRTSVEVQVQSGRANGDWGEVLDVALLRGGNGSAADSSGVNMCRHRTTVLGDGMGVGTGQVDSPGTSSLLGYLVHSEALTRALDRHSGSDGREANNGGGNLTEDNHGNGSSIEQ